MIEAAASRSPGRTETRMPEQERHRPLEFVEEQLHKRRAAAGTVELGSFDQVLFGRRVQRIVHR
jgi:hypothetical protein